MVEVDFYQIDTSNEPVLRVGRMGLAEISATPAVQHTNHRNSKIQYRK